MWLWELIGGAIITILFAFAGMIWRNLEGRVTNMEKDDKTAVDKRLDHPILTIAAHSVICSEKMGEFKNLLQGNTNQLLDKIEESEKRIGLMIENAILKSFQNGKNGRKKTK